MTTMKTGAELRAWLCRSTLGGLGALFGLEGGVVGAGEALAPVCPEGVTAAPWRITQGKDVWGTRVGIKGHGYFMLLVHPCGRIEPLGQNDDPTPALLRYVADLSEYRAALHAASDRQRKLDAVKAAEAAERDAETAKEIAWQAYDATLAPLGAARDALRTARREAGL